MVFQMKEQTLMTQYMFALKSGMLVLNSFFAATFAAARNYENPGHACFRSAIYITFELSGGSTRQTP